MSYFLWNLQGKFEIDSALLRLKGLTVVASRTWRRIINPIGWTEGRINTTKASWLASTIRLPQNAVLYCRWAVLFSEPQPLDIATHTNHLSTHYNSQPVLSRRLRTPTNGLVVVTERTYVWQCKRASPGFSVLRIMFVRYVAVLTGVWRTTQRVM